MRQRRPNAQEQEQEISHPWQIRSVPVKARDGPERLGHVYHLLLEPRPIPRLEREVFRPAEWDGAQPIESCAASAGEAKERLDAGGDLRPRLHPAPGA
jgi:hypothetical protein